MTAAAPRPRTALVLAAHGSRRDPEANALVAARAAQLARRGVADQVVAAYHQGSPSFTSALDSLDAERILVVPFFTSEGYYTRRVLPQALRQSARFDPHRVRQTPPLGVHPAIADLVARRARAVAAEFGLPLERTLLIVAGHGTGRHRQSRGATLALARALGERQVAAEARAAFLDDEPPIEAVLASAPGRHVLVIPFLIGGFHATRDLPRRLGLGHGTAPCQAVQEGRRVVLDAPVGRDDGLLELIADLAARELSGPAGPAGSVALVGAGPGDPGLITVRGLELLRAADVVLHDRLIPAQLLREVRPGALVIPVGKHPGRAAVPQEEINRLLVEHARRGARVVRLKGGDPFVFGRGAEELDACREAGVPCTVVPGVSSAIAVPAAAGIPVTARGSAASFAVLTGQLASGGGSIGALAARAAALDTLVVLMGRSGLQALTQELLAAGKDPDLPAAAIQNGTTPRQRVVTATLATLAEAADRAGLTAPIVTVIGSVAARAREGVPC